MQTPTGVITVLGTGIDDLTTLVAHLSDDDFALATRCPGWSVAELVAHCEGILIRLVGENAQPVEGQAEIDRVGYYQFDPHGPREGEDGHRTFSEIVRDRVINEVGGRLPAQLQRDLCTAARRALARLPRIPFDRVVKRSGHPRLTYGEFVASRNVEFGVHTMDIAHATGRPEQTRPEVAAVITDILDGLLGEPLPDTVGWDATTYILVATGRRELGPEDRARLGVLASRFPLLG